MWCCCWWCDGSYDHSFNGGGSSDDGDNDDHGGDDGDVRVFNVGGNYGDDDGASGVDDDWDYDGSGDGGNEEEEEDGSNDGVNKNNGGEDSDRGDSFNIGDDDNDSDDGNGGNSNDDDGNDYGDDDGDDSGHNGDAGGGDNGDNDDDNITGLHCEASILSDRNNKHYLPSRPYCHHQPTLPSIFLSIVLLESSSPSARAHVHLGEFLSNPFVFLVKYPLHNKKKIINIVFHQYPISRSRFTWLWHNLYGDETVSHSESLIAGFLNLFIYL